MYKAEHKELVERFGLNQEIARDLLASRNKSEVETVMNFLERYGHMIDLNSGRSFVR